MKFLKIFVAAVLLSVCSLAGSQALADTPVKVPSNPKIAETVDSILQTVTDTQIEAGNIEAKLDDHAAEVANYADEFNDIKFLVTEGTMTETFEGRFDGSDYPDGFTGIILEESYPEIRHVSLTVYAWDFHVSGGAYAKIWASFGGFTKPIGRHDTSKYGWPSWKMNTFDFNADHWGIELNTLTTGATFFYAVTLTYPR